MALLITSCVALGKYLTSQSLIFLICKMGLGVLIVHSWQVVDWIKEAHICKALSMGRLITGAKFLC